MRVQSEKKNKWLTGHFRVRTHPQNGFKAQPNIFASVITASAVRRLLAGCLVWVAGWSGWVPGWLAGLDGWLVAPGAVVGFFLRVGVGVKGHSCAYVRYKRPVNARTLKQTN